MNETQIYCTIMFLAGVLLTHAVFYFDRKIKKKKFYLFLSAVTLQALENIDLIHHSSIEFAKDSIKIAEDSEKQEYLEKENEKVSMLMELYVLLLLTSVPKEARRYMNYKNWAEAKVLIKKMRGLLQNGKGNW